MTPMDIYKIWAPAGAKWVEWARPVAFIAIDKISKAYAVEKLLPPPVSYLEEDGWNEACKDYAIIIDMAGEESVRTGISLARCGFRPVPLYNGTIEQPCARATVDNQSVARALKIWTSELKELDIEQGASPAFMLDSNRLNMYQMEETIYDNSWDIYPQDIPSPKYFMDNGIKKILVVGRNGIARDLKKVLISHQQSGMEIFHTNGYSTPERVKFKTKR